TSGPWPAARGSPIPTWATRPTSSALISTSRCGCADLPKRSGLAASAVSGSMEAMERLRIIRPLMLVAGLLGLAGAAAAQAQPALAAYAVLGIESGRVGPRVRVQFGRVGATAGSVRRAARAAVQGSVVADSVRVTRSTRVGRLFCRLVSGGAFGPRGGGGGAGGGAPGAPRR